MLSLDSSSRSSSSSSSDSANNAAIGNNLHSRLPHLGLKLRPLLDVQLHKCVHLALAEELGACENVLQISGQAVNIVTSAPKTQG
jgi:hypothetical protein